MGGCAAGLLAAALGVGEAEATQPPDCTRSGSEEQRDARARKLFEEAVALEATDARAALARLECADALVDRASVALRIGIVAEGLGLGPQAARGFERYLALAGDDAPDRGEIRRRIEALQGREPKPDAGPRAPGPEEELPRPAGLIVAGVGAAVALAGGALLVAAKIHNDEVHEPKDPKPAWNGEEGSELLEQAELEQTLGIAGLVAGGVIVGAGFAIAFVPLGGGTGNGNAVVALTPGSATLRLAF
jgi:hypothetical protein